MVKRPGPEADNSPPSNVEIKEHEVVSLLSYTPSLLDA
jgi:hypothetical protein